MAARRRRSGGNGLDAWPGYVDALSTLLMVIIFVLLVFVLAQGFLSVALSGRDKALDQVHRQLAELSDMLALERGKASDLGLSVARLNKELDAANAARAAGVQELAGLRDANGKLTAERDALRQQMDAAGAKASDADLQAQAAAARLAEQTRALAALRDELEKQAREAAARSLTEQQLRAAAAAQLTDEKKLGDSARAQIALLNQQLDELRAQMAQVSKALDLAEAAGRDKDTQIANLGQRLNAALAAKVEELQRYRSEFFGKLRDVLAGRPGIQIVGDRFVFQSEVLFPAGSADLTPDGEDADPAAGRNHPRHCPKHSPGGELAAAGGRSCRPPAGLGRRLRLQLGTLGRPRDHGGEAADRPGRPARTPGRHRFWRQAAAG